MPTKIERVFIVTGASRGLGRAIVREIFGIAAARGIECRVMGVARSKERLQELKDEFPGRFDFTVGDITATDVAARVVANAEYMWGRVDAVVQNAGLLEPLAPLASVSIPAVKRHFDVNLFSVIEMAQRALPLLRRTGGRMLLVSSGAATSAYHGWGAYCASKCALNMVAASLAIEEPEVTTLAIRPGVVDTDMQKLIREEGKGAMRPDQHQKFIDMHREGGLVPPEKSGHVFAALCFDAPKELSGKFLDWQATELTAYQKP